MTCSADKLDPDLGSVSPSRLQEAEPVAKSIYKIPISLARSFLDHEITLSGGGFQTRPIALKAILFWVGSLFTVFWVLSNTFLKHADWWLIGLVAIWWLVATAFFGRYSKTKELNIQSVPSLINYFTPSARRVVTRSSSDPSGFYSIAGIDDIDEGGFITWGDGTVGQAYLVVGSASVLVFEQDRIAIIDRVDAFWRKVDTTAELIWVTTKEPQRVYRQLANLERLNLSIDVDDPELFELMEERHSILTNYVGGSFSSIHQYLIIKADNVESLKRAHIVVRSEAEESSLMIKQLTQLDGADTHDMFHSVYATGQLSRV